MASESSEQHIRERAYHLWEQDGAPQGRADEYWEKARRQVDAEGDGEPPVSADQSTKRALEDAVPQDDGNEASGTVATPRAKRAR